MCCMFSPSVASNSLRPHGLQPSRLLCPWNFAGKNTGADCHFLLQGVLPAQGSDASLSVSCTGRQVLCTSAAWEAPAVCISSVQSLSHVLLLRPHGLQHTRLSCPSPTPGVYSNSCPSSWWCHPAISSSIILLSSCLQSFLASGSFPMSQFFTSDGQSIGVSTSASVLPMNIQDWFPLGWTGWISLLSKGLSTVFSNRSKASIL